MSGETFLEGRVTLHAGDCLDVLEKLPANSVDAVVTDPPYGLSFMGKAWDHGVPGAPFWRAVIRVLKPGAHLVAFGGSRTFGRMQVAIEEAGFEVRDAIANMIDASNAAGAFLGTLNDAQRAAFLHCVEDSQFGGLLAWCFGQGFPKSLDVSKAIDKRKDWSALPKLQIAIRDARVKLGISQSEAARRMGLIGPAETLGGGGYMWFETGMRAPTREQWPRLKSALRIGDEFDLCFEEAEREITGTVEEWSERSNYAITSKDGFRRDKPASDLALQWSGWGTALKPAFEPIIMARKPLAADTVAANVLAHGTGALNIDACRIESEKQTGWGGKAAGGGTWNDDTCGLTKGGAARPVAGRWPANLVHDGSAAVVAAFPSDAGAFAPVRGTEPSDVVDNVFGERGRQAGAFHADRGSASRFFYTSKADGDDRIGSKHPTVKPVDLMQWLVRLVTPPGGTVLDPFAGTGTTGEAAWREGFAAVLIEREAEYQADIRRRMALAIAGQAERARESIKAAGKVKDTGELPLFGGAL